MLKQNIIVMKILEDIDSTTDEEEIFENVLTNQVSI